jgi:hypothetical protein
MPERPPKLQIVPTRAQQLACVNEKISKLVATKPQSDIYGVFALSGRLARQAIDTALEIEKLPGVDLQQIQPVLNFWYRLQDYSRTAALCCAGGNQTLAEALITLRFLQRVAEEASNGS